MGKLVLDTNVLLKTLPRISPFHDLYLSLFDGRNELCVSNDIIEEYEEIIELKTNHFIAQSIIEQILNNPYTRFIDPYYAFNLIISDPEDNKFVDCAVASNAKYIVTNDRHFNILKEIDFPKIDIITIEEIMKTLQENIP